jgi:serine/threonine protein kinase
MAPETIGRPFHGDPRLANDFCADMWCLGETISRILTGRPTFEHHTLLQYQEGSIEFPEEPLRNAGASKRAIDFVRSLMHANPDRRLRAKQALLHPWLEFDPDGGQADNKLQSPTDGSEDIPVDYTGNPSDDQVTQASGEWTATMSLHAEDTQPSAKWTETVADPGDGLITQTNVGNSSAMDIAPPKPMGKGDIVDGGGKLQSNLPRYRRILLPPSALPRPLLPDHAAKKSSTAPAEAKGARAADTDREPTSKTKHSVDRTQRPSPGKRYTVVRPNPADEIRAMMERQRQLRSAKDAQKPKATPTQTLEVKLERDVPAWFRWVVGKVSS